MCLYMDACIIVYECFRTEIATVSSPDVSPEVYNNCLHVHACIIIYWLSKSDS